MDAHMDKGLTPATWTSWCQETTCIVVARQQRVGDWLLISRLVSLPQVFNTSSSLLVLHSHNLVFRSQTAMKNSNSAWFRQKRNISVQSWIATELTKGYTTSIRGKKDCKPVRVSNGTLPVWVGTWPCEKARHPEKQYSRFPDGFVSFRCK
jgi:hypothetical protein